MVDSLDILVLGGTEASTALIVDAVFSFGFYLLKSQQSFRSLS